MHDQVCPFGLGELRCEHEVAQLFNRRTCDVEERVGRCSKPRGFDGCYPDDLESETALWVILHRPGSRHELTVGHRSNRDPRSERRYRAHRFHVFPDECNRGSKPTRYPLEDLPEIALCDLRSTSLELIGSNPP